MRHADQQSKNSNKVSPTKSAQDSEEPTEVEDPNGEMEDFRLWVKVLGAGHLIKNTEEPLTHVSAEGLAKRRIRSGYRKAEFHLMSLNMARCKLLGIIIAPFAFCIRFPLRYNFLHKILKLALSTSRSKLAGSKNG